MPVRGTRQWQSPAGPSRMCSISRTTPFVWNGMRICPNSSGVRPSRDMMMWSTSAVFLAQFMTTGVVTDRACYRLNIGAVGVLDASVRSIGTGPDPGGSGLQILTTRCRVQNRTSIDVAG